MKSEWISLNLKTSLLVGASSLSAVGTTSGVFSNFSEGVFKAVKSSAQPIVDPFLKGYSKLSNQLDGFSKTGYNTGLDVTEWITSNFSKSRIKTGGVQIYQKLSSWYEVAKTFADGVKTFISTIFNKSSKEWEDIREKTHTIFKALGNTFPIIGSLLGGSMKGDGESTLKILFEAINEPKFSDFMSEVSTMASNNPNLLSELDMSDYTDVIFAFKQDSDTVVNTLKELNKEKDKKVDKGKLMSALKLFSLNGKAQHLLKRARQMLLSPDKSQISELIKEIENINQQLAGMISAQQSQA